MSSKRHHHRRQGGTNPTTEPQNSHGVAQFSVSEVAQFSMSLDTSLRTGADALLRHVRDRWSIENSWHWPRDTQLDEDAHRYGERNGGYTRIIRTVRRRGDNAEMAIIELV